MLSTQPNTSPSAHSGVFSRGVSGLRSRVYLVLSRWAPFTMGSADRLLWMCVVGHPRPSHATQHARTCRKSKHPHDPQDRGTLQDSNCHPPKKRTRTLSLSHTPFSASPLPWCVTIVAAGSLLSVTAPFTVLHDATVLTVKQALRTRVPRVKDTFNRFFAPHDIQFAHEFMDDVQLKHVQRSSSSSPSQSVTFSFISCNMKYGDKHFEIPVSDVVNCRWHPKKHLLLVQLTRRHILQVWDVDNNSMVRELDHGHTGWTDHFAWDPTGRYVPIRFSRSREAPAKSVIWDTWKSEPPSLKDIPGLISPHPWDYTGRFIITHTQEHCVCVWDVKLLFQHKCLDKCNVLRSGRGQGFDCHYRRHTKKPPFPSNSVAVAWHPSKHVIATNVIPSEVMDVWSLDVSNKHVQLMYTIDLKTNSLDIRWSPCGRYVSVIPLYKACIEIWNMETRQKHCTLLKHERAHLKMQWYKFGNFFCLFDPDEVDLSLIAVNIHDSKYKLVLDVHETSHDNAYTCKFAKGLKPCVYRVK